MHVYIEMVVEPVDIAYVVLDLFSTKMHLCCCSSQSSPSPIIRTELHMLRRQGHGHVAHALNVTSDNSIQAEKQAHYPTARCAQQLSKAVLWSSNSCTPVFNTFMQSSPMPLWRSPVKKIRTCASRLLIPLPVATTLVEAIPCLISQYAIRQNLQ